MTTHTKKKKHSKQSMSQHYQKHYVDMQIEQHFHRLEMKIADTKGELLNWFIKMFIGQITGFISIFITLANTIRD